MTLVDNFHPPASQSWKTLPLKGLENVATRPSRLLRIYIHLRIHPGQNPRTHPSPHGERGVSCVQNRVIQFHEGARRLYYGEINYYVPDVSRAFFPGPVCILILLFAPAKSCICIYSQNRGSSFVPLGP